MKFVLCSRLLERHILSLSSLETARLSDSDKLLFSLRGHLGEEEISQRKSFVLSEEMFYCSCCFAKFLSFNDSHIS